MLLSLSFSFVIALTIAPSLHVVRPSLTSEAKQVWKRVNDRVSNYRLPRCRIFSRQTARRRHCIGKRYSRRSSWWWWWRVSRRGNRPGIRIVGIPRAWRQWLRPRIDRRRSRPASRRRGRCRSRKWIQDPPGGYRSFCPRLAGAYRSLSGVYAANVARRVAADSLPARVVVLRFSAIRLDRVTGAAQRGRCERTRTAHNVRGPPHPDEERDPRAGTGATPAAVGVRTSHYGICEPGGGRTIGACGGSRPCTAWLLPIP